MVHTDIDAYLQTQPAAFRRALSSLRKLILEVAPTATQHIGYGVPLFKLEGKLLVSFAGFKTHCSFFVMSSGLLERMGAQVQKYLHGRGTLRFTPDAPLPAALVRKLVKARVRENAERG